MLTKKLKLIACIIFLYGTSVNAQSFKWQGKLEKVDRNGFYNITLTPDIISKTVNENLADVRIFEKNNEIAYLLRKKVDSTDSAGHKYFNIKHYTPIPQPSFKVRAVKATQQSIIEINFNEAYQVNKLILNVEGFKFYRREAWLAIPNPDFNNKKYRDEYIRLTAFIILSGKPTVIDLYGEEKYKQLYLFIENDDNAPLQVKKIEALQQDMYLTAYLEKDKSYQIKTGQSNMNLPRYDLAYFNDSIGSSLPFINVENLAFNKTEEKVTNDFVMSKKWMWAALAVLIVFIGYLSNKMIAEMQAKKRP